MVLNVYYEDALPKLQTVFSNQQIISFCVPHALQHGVFQTPASAILNVFMKFWKENSISDSDVLRALNLPRFSFDDSMSRFWIKVMESRYNEDKRGSMMADIIFQMFEKDVPTLIAGGVNTNPTYRSILVNLERLSKE
ncbi:uncharacterized protein PHALS_13830 [Plasmopara halstedii]|uniref:Uncharacterized protein n=1 Tax=Plasmopara halstedii TaxID=4781 RepID=A0A0P1AR46_PLAHL|nr:uncharacterized protein PHALS_13830 [Plasmopara halstedii]CEG43638.1 hypothetical protein PHALS_13830 [Plasmopara halstedii]|eukprot:XP_024580007.1 hypothetical protein PHALS_13830 [Plasmopara halstedii]